MDWFVALWAISLAVAAAYAALWWREQDKADHAKCIAHVASVTSNRVVALAFREAAARYDSIEGMADLRRISNTQFDSEGLPIPALWMLEQADRIDSPSGIPYFR
jgi:Flp pilus assembly protein TadB